MSAALIHFPSRGRYSCRESAAFESATVAGGRMVCITPQQGQNNPARITFTARHPRSIVVRGLNDNRFVISQAPIGAGEVRAYCCNLTGLVGQGASTDFLNFVRALVPGNLIRALLQPLQKSVSRCADRLHFHRLSAGPSGLVAHSERTQSMRRERACPTQGGSNPTPNRVKAS